MHSFGQALAEPVPRSKVDGRLLGLLALVPMLVYLVSGPTFLGYDGTIMLQVTESMLFKHSLQITDPMFHMSEPYSFFGLGVSLLLIPFVAIGHALFGSSTILLSLFQPLITAATVAALWLLLRELGVGRRRALWIAWLYGFGTLAWHYAGVLFSEPLVALCLTIAMLASMRFGWSGRPLSLLLAGSVVGMAVIARVDSALLIALPIACYVLVRIIQRQRRESATSAKPASWSRAMLQLAAFGGPVMLGGAVDIWYDWVRYGKPLQLSYASEGLGFTFPLLKGIYGLLLSPGAGVFVFMPVLVFALLGFMSFRRRWPLECALVIAVVGGRVLFYASWSLWDGGASWGPRFLVPVLPMMMIGLGFLAVNEWRRVGLWVAACLSVGIELLGQLVWFGTWFAATAAVLAPRVDLPACGTCGVRSLLGVERLKLLMDFDWRYSPLVGQLRLLLEGAAHPAWAPIGWLMPILVLGMVGCGWYQWRLAGVVDEARPHPTQQAA